MRLSRSHDCYLLRVSLGLLRLLSARSPSFGTTLLHQNFEIQARLLMAIVAGYATSFCSSFLTNCRRISKFRQPVPGGHCRGVTVEAIASVSINMAIDTLIALLPMRPLWGLQMAMSEKVGISILFVLGLL